ncbi:MAG TPA: MlaD family protein [Bacteroidia bacterium]|nr:MlaD family protein [Bacteroidia bacterium]
MEKHIKYSVRLGIFVTLSLLLLISGIYFIGSRQKLFSNSFRVTGVFRDITGLQVGNNVRYSGINVGIVEKILQLTDSSVSVLMLIERSTQKFIKVDATATIGSDGLMGNKIVVVSPGKASRIAIADGAFILTAIPVSLDEILAKLKITGDNSAIISGNLAAITENLREGKGTIGMLLMDTLFAKDVAITVLNIKEGSGGFKQNMDAAGRSFLLKGQIRKAGK